MKKLLGILVLMLLPLISLWQVQLWGDIYSGKELSEYESWHIEMILDQEYSRNFVSDGKIIEGVKFESYRNYSKNEFYELIADLRLVESLLNKKYPNPMELLSPKIHRKTLSFAELGGKENISKRMFLDKLVILNIVGKKSFSEEYVNKISIEIFDRYMLEQK